MTTSDIASQERNPTYATVSASDIVPTEGRGFIDLTGHHTNYGAGLANEEIARYKLASGEKLQVWRLGCQLKGGGANSNVVLDVYDVTNNKQLASVTGGTLDVPSSSEPLGETDPGASDVLLRLSTGGTDVDITLQGILNITIEN